MYSIFGKFVFFGLSCHTKLNLTVMYQKDVLGSDYFHFFVVINLLKKYSIIKSRLEKENADFFGKIF